MFPLNFIGYINGIFLIILFWHLAKSEKMSFVNEPFSNLLSKEMHPRTAKSAKIILILFLISQYLFFINLILKIGVANILEPIVFLSISTIAGIILALKPPVYKYDVHHVAAIISLGLMGIGAVILNLKLIKLNIYNNISLISLTVATITVGLLLYWGRLQKLNAK